MHGNDQTIRLEHRLLPFLERGLLRGVPTAWQIRQGTLEMMPYVVSPHVTSEPSYRQNLVANPVVRQLFLIPLIGLSHFNIGAGLSVGSESVARHLLLTWHEGMPVYDLQLAQTHPDGLARVRRRFELALTPQSFEDRVLRNQAERLFPDATEYFMRFLAPGGWIERAAAYDYERFDSSAGEMPAEFCSLTSFLNHCLDMPRTFADVGLFEAPQHLIRLGTRRLRGKVRAFS